MLRSLVGSEMCIRDRQESYPEVKKAPQEENGNRDKLRSTHELSDAPRKRLRSFEDDVTQIGHLSLGLRSDWTIRAWVVIKSEIQKTNSDERETFFTADLVDDHEDAIKATFWNDAAKKFHNKMEVGSEYFISGGEIVGDDTNKTPKQQLSLKLEKNARVEKASDRTKEKSVGSFKTLSEIQKLESEQKFNVIFAVGRMVEKIRREDAEFIKMSVFDQSLKKMKLLLPQEVSAGKNFSFGQIFAVQGCKLARDGEEKVIEATSSSVLISEDKLAYDNIPEVHILSTVINIYPQDKH
eukprot:TRINITY_DN6340_c0_g2_i4.p1 TRINITY_DN6340_c0_g2~~TRINITY_DN6340_c0_g2_i4.p1  ORF type:complete len:296 (+),score=79.94 TRINITY_DN6340_c0_g2_i4:226-1113(+)